MYSLQPAPIPIIKETDIHKPLSDVTGAILDFISRSKSFSFEEKLSDSPFIETIWRTPFITTPPTRIGNCGSFIFPAVRHWGLVITKNRNETTLTIWGPGMKAAPAQCPKKSDLWGIIFKPGVFMPSFPPNMIRDRRDIVLPEATSNSFWLNGSVWQFPDYDNADTFVDRLVHDDLLVREEMVDIMLQGQLKDWSLRTAQRRFLQATGLTLSTVRQIERASIAKDLLQHGSSILDTIAQAGYYDQAHLTRSLKHYIGVTPAQISRLSQAN